MEQKCGIDKSPVHKIPPSYPADDPSDCEDDSNVKKCDHDKSPGHMKPPPGDESLDQEDDISEDLDGDELLTRMGYTL